MHDPSTDHTYAHGALSMLGVFASLLITLFVVALGLLHVTTPRLAYGGGVIAVLIHSKLLLVRLGY